MTLSCELSVVETESVLGVNVSFLQEVNIIAAAKIVAPNESENEFEIFIHNKIYLRLFDKDKIFFLIEKSFFNFF